MELEQLMARARHRAHFTQARERRRVEKQQRQQARRLDPPAKPEAAILKFAAAPAARVSAQGTQVLLPDSVLDMVMERLASCLEAGGVYGPSLVARDLANASLVCSEFYCAAQFGFSALNSNIQQSLQQQLQRQPLPPPPSIYLGVKVRQAHTAAVALSAGMNLPGPKGWHFWDVLVTQPLAIKISELEEAARQMGIVDVLPPRQRAAAGAVAPGAAAHAEPAAATQTDSGDAAAAETGATGATAVAKKGGSSSSNKHRARVISKLLSCFGLTQPLPMMPAAAASASVSAPTSAERARGAASGTAVTSQCLAPAHHIAAAGTAKAASPTSQSAAAAAPALQPPASNSQSSAGGRAALLRAVTLERCCPIIAGDGPDKCSGLLAAVRELSEIGYKPAARAQPYNGVRGCLAKVRAELAAAGIGSREVLMHVLQQQRDAAAAKRQQQRQQQQQQRRTAGKRSAGVAAAAAMGGAAAKRAKGFSLSSVSIRVTEKNHAFCD